MPDAHSHLSRYAAARRQRASATQARKASVLQKPVPPPPARRILQRTAQRTPVTRPPRREGRRKADGEKDKRQRSPWGRGASRAGLFRDA